MRFGRGGSKSSNPPIPRPPLPTYVAVIGRPGDNSVPLGATPSPSRDDAGADAKSGPPPPTSAVEPGPGTPGEPTEPTEPTGTPVTVPAESSENQAKADAALAESSDQPAPLEGAEPSQVAASAVPVPPTPEPPAERRRFSRRRARPRHRRPRRTWRVILAVLAVIVALFGASAIVVAHRLGAQPPQAFVRSTLPSSRLVAGSAPALSWPAGVQSAIVIPALGVTAQSGPEVAEPIASVTKLMTARVVLTDHPLSVGAPGPTITITPNDVTLDEEDAQSGQANIQVATGEVLTEYQLLEGMLVHSASNFADLLAIWDAGSISAFVAKMNSTATSLGMTQTQYFDASGYLAQSVSTATDQLKVASMDLANPVFGQIVDMPAVTLPVAGTVESYTPLVGTDGVVGVKSGFTTAAGGCDVLALLEGVHGVPVEVLAAVIGEHVGTDVITDAGMDALSIARPAASSVQFVDIAPRGSRVATASIPGHSVSVVARSDLAVIAWPGQRITESLHVARRPRAGAPAGWRVGSVTIRVGPEKFQLVVRTAKRLPSPTFLQRVF